MDNINDFSIKLDKNAQIIDLLSKYANVWNNNSTLQQVVDALISNQRTLEELFALFSKELTTSDLSKNDLRKELETCVVTIVKILQSFAQKKEKIKLLEQLYHLNQEYIQNCSDKELIKIAKKSWLNANKYGGYALTFVNKIKASLNPDNLKITRKFEKEFGLNPEMIKKLEEALLRFIEAKVQNKVEMEEKETLAIKIKEINKQSKKIILKKIDRYALLVEIDKPDFYLEYINLKKALFPKNDDK